MGREIKLLSFQIWVVTNLTAPNCFCLCSFCFWGEVSNSWILKISAETPCWEKDLMRTFTFRSTFLYAYNPSPFSLPLCRFWLVCNCWQLRQEDDRNPCEGKGVWMWRNFIFKYGVRPQFIWAPVYSWTHWLRPRNSPPSPPIWAHIRGRYWSANIDDISL